MSRLQGWAVSAALVLFGLAILGISLMPPTNKLGITTGALTTLINGVVTTTTGSELPMSGHTMAVFDVASSVTATVVFYGTVDGSTWTALALSDLSSTTRAREASTTSSKLLLLEDAGGIISVRPSVTSWTSGTVTVKGRSF